MVYCKNRAKDVFRYPSRKEPASALQEPVRQFQKSGLTPAFSHSFLKKRKRKLRKNFLVFTHYPGNFFTKTLGTPCGGGAGPRKER